MALRLTGPLSPTDDTAATPTVTPAQLVADARAALARDELDAYGELRERAAQLEGPQDRYQAEVGLLEQGLLAARSAEGRGAVRLYAEAAEHALTALERGPREPIILNYAGIACYELWGLDAAQTLFTAARRLDPGLANVDRNLSELGRRRRGQRPRRPLHPSVPALARRAQRVAAGAQPAAGLTLSLCMIVRDEEQMLGRCLAAAAPAVDEIVVVDTGSTDRTVEIARSFGARVIEQPWTGSFAEARNTSLAAATGDWIVYLDADEVLADADAQRLRALTGHVWREAMYLTLTSFTGELEDGDAVVNNALRVLRNRPEYRFEGRIHEQIAHTLPRSPGRIAHTSVRVEHYGYLGDVRAAKEKSTRNLALLHRQAQEQTPTAFTHYNLGCEYAAAGDPRAAISEYARAWALISRDGTARTEAFVPALFGGWVRMLRASGRDEEAATRAQEGLELLPEFTDLVLEQAVAARTAGRLEQARGLYERCVTMGDAPARLGGTVGAGSFRPRAALALLSLQAGALDDALEQLDWCLEHHPSFFGVIAPFVTVRSAQGLAPAEIVTELESRLVSLPPSARLTLARALGRIGAVAPAAAAYRVVADSGDALGAAAQAELAELLLAAGEYGEAARHAAALTGDGPYAGLGCRIEVCARAADGDEAGARSVLRDAGSTLLSAPEQDVLEALIDADCGRPARVGLPVAGVPLMATLLEFALRARDDARFVRLAPLLEHSALGARERRQLLAEMQLRHGRLAGAAQQWMAAAEERPDAAALLGLAQVATAQRLTDDAIVFATGALELEPSHAAARALLTKLQKTVEPTAVGAVDR